MVNRVGKKRSLHGVCDSAIRGGHTTMMMKGIQQLHS